MISGGSTVVAHHIVSVQISYRSDEAHKSSFSWRQSRLEKLKLIKKQNVANQVYEKYKVNLRNLQYEGKNETKVIQNRERIAQISNSCDHSQN